MNHNQVQELLSRHDHIVLFDGVCNVCSGWVQFVIDRDPHAEFSFCSVQSEAGAALLQHIGLEPSQIETMAYIRFGEASLRSTAVLEMARKLPAPWSLFAWGLYIPSGLRDWLYTLVAKNRYRIAGKKQSCLVPPDELKPRFIEWNFP